MSPTSKPNTIILRVSLTIIAAAVLILGGCQESSWTTVEIENNARPVTLDWEANGPIFSRVQFISDSVGWGTSTDGTVWYSKDGGETWELRFAREDLIEVQAHLLRDGLKGWVVGTTRDTAFRDDSKIVISRTTDGGVSWEEVSQTVADSIKFIHFSSENYGCIAGGRTFSCTTDGGRTWSPIGGTPTIPKWSGLYFLEDGLHGWAWAQIFNRSATGGWENEPRGTLILGTTDGGQSWRATSSEIQEGILALSFLPDGQRGWALATDHSGRYLYADGTKVLFTADAGASWLPISRNLDSRLKRIHFAPDGINGWLIGSANFPDYFPANYFETPRKLSEPLLFHTSDGGKIWTRQDPGSDDEWIDIDFSPASFRGWIVGGRGSLVRTHDGSHWEAVEKPTVDDLGAIKLTRDGRNGWALSAKGMILYTKDSGLRWIRQYFHEGKFYDLQIDRDGRRGWALGEGEPCKDEEIQLLSTKDGGEHWQSSCVDIGHDIIQAQLTSDSSGWIIAADSGGATLFSGGETLKWGPKFLMFTQDSGQTWETRHVVNDTASSFVTYFSPDRPLGWILSSDWTLLHTPDNGRTWTERKVDSLQDKGYKITALTFLSNGQKGWAVGGVGGENRTGGKCLILHTADGGITWNRQDDGTLDGILNSVDFLDDGLRGWATGSEGSILYTSDGGENWQLQPKVRAANADLLSAHFINDEKGIRGWIVGQYGTVLRSVGRKSHPVLKQYQVSSSPSGVLLRWRLDEDEVASLWTPDALKWKIEYCSQKKCPVEGWQQILDWEALKPDRTNNRATFSFSWNPTDHGIGPGTQIHYRLRIDDGRQKLAPQYLGVHTYEPLWNRLEGWQKAILIGSTIVVGYLLVCFLLLWVYPGALLWMNERLSIRELIEPWAPDSLKAIVPTTLAFVPWFAKHQRVNQAWVNRYLTNGNLSFRDLSPDIRKRYVEREISLDAWVTRHLPAAQDLFLRLPTVAQRNFHILMPVRIETEDSNTLFDQPQPKDFRPFTQVSRLLITFVGIGGAGKSSLACQVARWSMSSLSEQRLAKHRMVPILIEEDTIDLLGSIKGQLTIIAGEDLPEDLLRSLLAKQRLLIIVDALSEKSRNMQEHVSTIYKTAPVHALIITTRRAIHVLGATQVSIRPEEITVDRLAYFLIEYLKVSKRDQLFPRRKALELADRLLSIAEAEEKNLPLTPLLIVLFVTQAIQLAEQEKDLTLLPASIPETMIKYIRQLNANHTLPEGRLIDSTLIVAQLSLGANYYPHDFERGKAMAALKESGLWGESYDVLEQLSDCGILERRESAGTVLYRFKFDPVAEYMAALERVRTLGDDQAAWDLWLGTLKNTDGYPRGMEGFLTSLEVCVSTYQKEFNLPFLQITETHDNRSSDITPGPNTCIN